jgi:alkylation response protein AidB-like acyl-CoA dehydrogenase
VNTPEQDEQMLINTSKMSDGKRDALEVAEAARQTQWRLPSFCSEIFMGHWRADLIYPFPSQPADDKAEGDAHLKRIGDFLRTELDPDEVDRTGIIPEAVMKGLAALGVFALKVPRSYGGLGLSQVNYNRIMMLMASYCGSTTVLASAHQSIGVPQPLKMFGTEAQKQKYYPQFVKGAISAFALTEPGVGSDPAQMETEAKVSSDGRFYTLNGAKQWCTNSPIADCFVVMAKTKPKVVRGKERQQVTAFIVERGMPGIEVTQRCEFMGLSGMQNGNLKFTNVRVPAENMIGPEGKGLKLALETLNIGRLTLPAGCTGMAKQCLSIARRYGNKRVQWGLPIGHHEVGRQKIAFIASTTFAMEALTMLTSRYADMGNVDIRLEAAMAKYFCSENGWRIVDATLQLRGGRGYEKAASLKERGEDPYPVERMMRDARINTIIEGTSEIMRLFLAREAMDPHLKRAANLLKKHVAIGTRIGTVFKMLGFYAPWYLRQWLSLLPQSLPRGTAPLARHFRYVIRCSHRLARTLLHAMARYGPALERRQIVLGHLMDIGTELFAMSATCSYALSCKKSQGHSMSLELADVFCKQAARRIAAHFAALRSNNNREINSLAKKVSEGHARSLEEGIVWIGPDD